MRRYMLSGASIALGLTSLFAACTDGDDAATPFEDGGTGDASQVDATPDAVPSDAALPRCNRGFCRIDLPNPNIHNLSQWIFAGIADDPSTGTWAIANGQTDDAAGTAHLLHFENDTFRVEAALYLVEGASQWPIRLHALASDGAGTLIAVGTAPNAGTGVLVRRTGGTLRVERFGAQLQAAWSSGPGNTWLGGAGGALFRAASDGGWESERTDGGNYVSMWGTGPNDVYAGGTILMLPPPRDPHPPKPKSPEDPEDPVDASGPGQPGEPDGGKPQTPVTYGYLAHRTPNEAGVPTWSSSIFPDIQNTGYDPTIRAGVARQDGPRFWSSRGILARGVTEGGVAKWGRDPFAVPITIRGFAARAENDIWAIGDSGRIYRYDGTSWSNASIAFGGAPLVANLTAVTSSASGRLFIVGEGIALRSESP